jgi:hypothetical protein
MDSGASNVFIKNMKFFHTLKDIPDGNVYVGKEGVSYTVNKIGTIKLKLRNQNVIFLPNCVYAPMAPGNFISIPALDKLGYSFKIVDGCMTIFDKNDYKKLTTARLCSKTSLYYLDAELVENPDWMTQHARHPDAMRLNALSTHALLHRRYGHISHPILSRTIHKITNKKLRNSIFKCAACDISGSKNTKVGKRKAKEVEKDTVSDSKAISINKRRKKNKTEVRNKNMNAEKALRIDNKNNKFASKTDNTIERIHSDLKSLPRSIRGYNYFAAFVHEPTRFVQIRKFKRKSELSDAAKSYIEWAQKHAVTYQ